MSDLIVYTDGACKGNGKGKAAGGFGVFIDEGDAYRRIWGGEADTTNNRMELTAAIVALQNTSKDDAITLYTDSNYLKQGVEKWIDGWKKRGWKKADGKPVLNQDLWQKLDALSGDRRIHWRWIKGHDGNFGNETADKLANLGVRGSGDERTPKPAARRPSANVDPKKPSETQAMQNDNTAAFDTPFDGDTSRLNPSFRPLLPAPIHKGYADRQLIMDTETTGFEEKNGDRVIEVGMIEMIGRKFTGEKLHVYLNPDKEMDDEVIRVHGISNEFLQDKPRFADVAAQIYDFAQGAQLVAHNAEFDMRFLTMEFAKAGFDDFADKVTVLDTLAIAKQMYPGQRVSLDALVKRLNVGKKDRTFHGALLDSEILAQVYLAMTGGQVALAIDDDDGQHTDAHHNENLEDLATLLLRSVDDKKADAAWRKAHFGS